ncbi:precorrin-2 C(20)-methyltransferase [Fusobacterium necrophorum subsp. funduliforme]|uniref:Cobalt-precorrin-2 C(20)-methyltransferase n=3 Tax=Fusobacterium necrophorum TaxID=859 RepID=A0AAN3VUW2_9FUSO|nr:precorrin-2 C(20)-methyltransferase [Fusobacterium necrophorum]EHO20757.1 precorrin-2 C20-methyltransferase [Fusobacterium necrophorum subsp. funduliforme 1_1_36S]AVQ20638.1 precorrin-2 C(20)-methyltransferase [Fusobacterium necrophorum subsp. funduliforme]AYV92371.1 precorrin-2 C(20)-methyltransferase [Fusobacterium necrophorum subsp. funduliforme]AYV94309.1 precorrin-2 C(20)-methyltransferase [Fusobacterium necrophorum subsp. funduliforme]EFS24214.1 precorrin-2 C(20)-methyltransferase [Fu
MNNKFYGIGVGVGDPEEITLKAINILKKLDVVVLPEAKKDEGSVAYEITKQYMKEEIEKVFMEFPMLKSLEERREARKRNAMFIQELLEQGKNVGFLTIGDTMTYSTYVYLLEHLPEKYLVETVPGISSFVDMASRFNFPLMIGEESLKVVSLNPKTDIEAEIASADNIVFMKVSRSFERLKQAILATGNQENVIMVSNCGKENQVVAYNIEELEEEDIPYFTTLILKKGGMKQWRKFTL